MNLFDPQGQCPVCHSTWVKDGTRLYVCRNGLFDIDDMHSIRLLAPMVGATGWIISYLTNGAQVWWCESGLCHVKLSLYDKLTTINFIPPFNISYQRLKRLLLFS